MILKRPVLEVLMVGFTHHIDIGRDVPAMIYYGTDELTVMRLPGADAVTGRWQLADDGWEVTWSDGRRGRWHIDHEPGSLAYLDGENVRRGTIVRITAGDAERLA